MWAEPQSIQVVVDQKFPGTHTARTFCTLTMMQTRGYLYYKPCDSSLFIQFNQHFDDLHNDTCVYADLSGC